MNEILWGLEMDVDIGALMSQAAERLGADGEALNRSLDFCRQRLHNQLRERGYSHGVVSLAVGSVGQRPLQVLRMLEALVEAGGEPWFEPLVSSAVRVANILSKSGNEAGASAPSGGAYASDEERTLASALETVEEAVASALKSCDWAAACKAISGLSGAISGFFDGVMVMDPDTAIRLARIGLLTRCKNLFDSIGDFSLMKQ
jgi:glycyl-tRNA synthetase beta chain